jgi:purine catabolism regulator
MNGAQPTVADVLALPEVQAGQPVVLAGETGLQRPVRWVHVLELSKVEGLLRGGELVLSTGVALPTNNDELRRYIEDLDRNHTSGVLLQLGERWLTPPPALVRAADRVGLPLVGLRTEVAFVAITERVHASIVSGSYAELRASERIYDLFSRRGIDAAPARQVVEELAEVAGAPVVFESLTHRVLEAAPAGRDRGNVLGDWERRSRRATVVPEDGGAGPEGWLVRSVTARGEHFGRLVLQPGPGMRPTRLQVLAVEQAALALALGRLLRGEGPHLERRAHAELLADLVEHRFRSDNEAHLRTQAAGVPTLRRALTGLALATAGPAPPDRDADLGDLLRAAERTRVPVLAASGGTTVSVLLSLPPSEDVDRAVAALADAVTQDVAARLPGHRVVVGRGPTVTELYDVAAALRDAEHAAVAALQAAAAPRVVTLADVGVHGLLAQWGDDGRLQGYVERQLAPLLDGSPGTSLLLAALRAFLQQGGNKSAAAAALHLSRPALYARLEQVADRLGVDLDDVEVRLSLHLALAAHDALASLTQ